MVPWRQEILEVRVLGALVPWYPGDGTVVPWRREILEVRVLGTLVPWCPGDGTVVPWRREVLNLQGTVVPLRALIQLGSTSGIQRSEDHR